MQASANLAFMNGSFFRTTWVHHQTFDLHPLESIPSLLSEIDRASIHASGVSLPC